MNYLELLDVYPRVQQFFQPFTSFFGETASFTQAEYFEHVSQNFHRVPITESYWMAGEPALATHLFISGSAMDAIAWLNQNHQRYRQLNDLFFIAVGAVPTKVHAEIIQKHKLKKLHFIFSNDPLGATCDLKLAAYIRNKPLKISYYGNTFEVSFENKWYAFKSLSLNALEKASGYNFLIRTHKPKNASTYYEQLSNRHHP